MWVVDRKQRIYLEWSKSNKQACTYMSSNGAFKLQRKNRYFLVVLLSWGVTSGLFTLFCPQDTCIGSHISRLFLKTPVTLPFAQHYRGYQSPSHGHAVMPSQNRITWNGLTRLDVGNFPDLTPPLSKSRLHMISK